MRPAPTRSPDASGFTLLEVIIAMAILSISLVAIAGINTSAIDVHVFSKKLTIATLLARSKMADLESKLQSEDLQAQDTADDGVFDKEGFPDFSWKAEILRPKTENFSVDQIMELFQSTLSSNDSPGTTKAPAPSLLSGLTGSGSGNDGAGSAAANASGGLVNEMMKSQLQSMIDLLGKSMREVRLTVSWKTGAQVDQFTVVTHVLNLGKEGASPLSPQDSANKDTDGKALDQATTPRGTSK